MPRLVIPTTYEPEHGEVSETANTVHERDDEAALLVDQFERPIPRRRERVKFGFCK